MKFDIKTLSSVNNPSSIHGIYPYRGKISAIDAQQIVAQMPVGATLLDPFCGSGTIVYEGMKHGLRSFGVDANPIATILSNGKISIPLDYNIIKEEVERFVALAEKNSSPATAPDYTVSYFHPETLAQIMKMSIFFTEMSPYLKACFVGAIALCARGCNDYTWTSSTVGKNIEPKRFIDFYQKLLYKTKKHFFPVETNGKVFFGDTRRLGELLEKDSIDFVFSSPPYFDCLDYTAYYARFVYEILGYDRLAVRDTLIQDFVNYEEDMKTVLGQLYEVVKPGGHVIFVVGDKKMHGKVINGGEFFNAISPFKHVQTIERSYSGSSSKVFDEINKTDRKEQVIIWQK